MEIRPSRLHESVRKLARLRYIMAAGLSVAAFSVVAAPTGALAAAPQWQAQAQDQQANCGNESADSHGSGLIGIGLSVLNNIHVLDNQNINDSCNNSQQQKQGQQ